MSLYGTNNRPLSLLPFPFLCCGRRGNAWVAYGPRSCSDDDVSEGIAPGDTWTSTTKAFLNLHPCKVQSISAYLTLPDDRRLTCTTQYRGWSTEIIFFIIMDGVDSCSVRSGLDDTPTYQKCAGNYGSNVPCCCQEGTGTVSPQNQCPQSKPTCVNYVYNKHWGTCEKATLCAGNYGSNVPCCSQEGTGTVSPQYQCPQSKPNCVNYVYNEHWGTCVAACDGGCP